MSRDATLERAQALFHELALPMEARDSQKRQLARALTKVHHAEPRREDRLSPAKAYRLWQGYFNKIALEAHEYLAIVRAIAEQHAREQDALISAARRIGLQELDELDAESAEIEDFIARRGRRARLNGSPQNRQRFIEAGTRARKAREE